MECFLKFFGINSKLDLFYIFTGEMEIIKVVAN